MNLDLVMFETLLLAASISPLIGFLIWLIVFVIVAYLAYLLINVLPLPDPWRTIVLVLVLLILLLILVTQTGLIAL